MSYGRMRMNHIIYNTVTLAQVDGFENKGPADICLKVRTDKGEQDLAVTTFDRLMALRNKT